MAARRLSSGLGGLGPDATSPFTVPWQAKGGDGAASSAGFQAGGLEPILRCLGGEEKLAQAGIEREKLSELLHVAGFKRAKTSTPSPPWLDGGAAGVGLSWGLHCGPQGRGRPD